MTTEVEKSKQKPKKNKTKPFFFQKNVFKITNYSTRENTIKTL